MKLRNGFVSNSSTCSFLIYGINGETDEITDALIENGIIPKGAKDEEDGIGYWLDEHSEVFKKLSHWMLYDEESMAIGRSWQQVGDDQTGKQFKEEIEAAIKQLVGDKFTCETHDAQWQC